jgi:riboflavin biosynthesis pyrimidine reductase
MGRMRALIPHGDDQPADVHAHYAMDWIDSGGVRVNFVSSVDGSATADGLSRGLQTPGDQVVFAALRDLADVVLVGAATAGAERYRPSSPSPQRQAIREKYGLSAAPAIAVMSSTLSLDLSDELFTAARPEAPTLIVTASTAPVAARNDVIDLAGTSAAVQLLEAPADAGGRVSFAAAVSHLHELGYHRILCEGGPRLFSSAVLAGAVNELCLSVSPVLVGPNGLRVVNGEPWPDGFCPRLELAGLLTDEDALFCRYLVDPSRPA